MALRGGLGCNAKGATKGIQRGYKGAYKGEVAAGAKKSEKIQFSRNSGMPCRALGGHHGGSKDDLKRPRDPLLSHWPNSPLHPPPAPDDPRPIPSRSQADLRPIPGRPQAYGGDRGKVERRQNVLAGGPGRPQSVHRAPTERPQSVHRETIGRR